MKWCKLLATVLIAAWLLSGCVPPRPPTPGRATVKGDGYAVSVDQPENADEPATIVVEIIPAADAPSHPTTQPAADKPAESKPRVRITVSTGSAQPPTAAAIAAGHAWRAWLVGPGIMLAGVGLIYVRMRWMKRMPTAMITGTILVGAAVLAWGVAGPSVPTWVWTIGVLGAFAIVGVIVIPGYIANRRAETREAATTAAPGGEGAGP
ncbi:MAG TPA: hypothetical protein VMW52_10920 [Phycisphaerae bacterium]|nr:hypothetical protein [Phycisphaerae bacterium]